jgi:hypothetical protein
MTEVRSVEAQVGSHLVIEPKKVGVAPRRGEIVEVLRGPGGEHYRVRWEDDQHESIYYPAPGAYIEGSTGR